MLVAAASLVPVVTLATPCLLIFVVVRAGIQAPLSTISYDLGALGARNAGVAIGTAMRMLNLVRAAGATVAPLLGGAVLAGAGARRVFAGLALTCAAAGLSMRRDGGPLPAPARQVRRRSRDSASGSAAAFGTTWPLRAPRTGSR